ncbi:ATP synthase F0 subcomplex A subunit [Flavobacterium micromati]|jgi:F-type H+-transporting ATPase subunit a|uniref:ATP synthase subunit a n=1 Tax=Flavobacterium micromati TaxID=229205 RepID=A0A1M5L1P2_9FLAO|nr:F0F1 ATP synthase subunit A [Flavobacterium micromati]MCL6462818.1 F0F1 ATP synthase subunit A [Flavobacterium micromati]SHG58937.1 ATP synthase F0 subcomplex A subunit [Flavobacterium micromati]
MVFSNKLVQFILVAVIASIPYFAAANPEADNVPVANEAVTDHKAGAPHEKEAFNATKLINDHIGDSHEFHIADWNDHPITFYLPVILWTNNGLEVFSSEKFHHDNKAEHFVDQNGQKLVRYNEIIFYADKFEALTQDQKDLGAFEFDARPLNFSITKNVFSMFISAIVMFLLFLVVARSYKKNQLAPKGIAGFLEPLVTFVRDDIARPNIGEKKYAQYMPYLLTIFFFIWINNLIGLIPFFPFSSNLTGNIYFTFVLAFITFIVTTLSGNKEYWGHIFNTPGVPVWLAPIMIPVEIIGMLTKPFALMIRLFANITAGHIIILSLISLIFIFESVAVSPISGAFVVFMTVLEMLVAALQAYIFTLLSALFIGQAVAEHDHH